MKKFFLVTVVCLLFLMSTSALADSIEDNWDENRVTVMEDEEPEAPLADDIVETPAPSAEPETQTPQAAIPERGTAYATSYPILVNGQRVAFDVYALKDEAGNDTNYFKLRDVAYVLDHTSAQFNVEWDAAVGIAVTTKTAYAARNGSEMATPLHGDQPYVLSKDTIRIDGAESSMKAIVLTDEAKNGYTYFKLRDLGQELGFSVAWDQANQCVLIETE